MGNSLWYLSMGCSIGEGPPSSHGAMSARDWFGCGFWGRLPGETAVSLSNLRMRMSVLLLCKLLSGYARMQEAAQNNICSQASGELAQRYEVSRHPI